MTSPFDQVSQRLNGERDLVRTITAELDREDERTSVELLRQTFTEFVNFVNTHNYPFASVREEWGKKFVAYQLYDRTTSDGDVFFRNAPASLLINERQEGCLVKEPYYSGMGFQTFVQTNTPPTQIPLPEDATDYQRFAQAMAPDVMSRFQLRDIIHWVAFMQRFMEASQEPAFVHKSYSMTSSDFILDDYVRRSEAYEAIIEQSYGGTQRFARSTRYMDALVAARTGRR